MEGLPSGTPNRRPSPPVATIQFPSLLAYCGQDPKLAPVQTPQIFETTNNPSDRGGGIEEKQQTWLPNQHDPSAQQAILEWEGRIRLGFQPSMHRHIQAILAATAATSQRTGVALPCFIPRGASPSTALQIATQIDPFDRVLNTALPARSRTTIRRTSINASTVQTMRHRAIRHLKWVSLKPKPMRGSLAARFPVRTPARKLNIPLIMFLIKHLDYPDVKIPMDLSEGVDITGNIQPSRSLTERAIQPTTNMARAKVNLVARNRSILRHITRTGNPTLQRK